MPFKAGQNQVGGILDPAQTSLSLTQRRTYDRLRAQGIADNIARQLAIALVKTADARVPVERDEADRRPVSLAKSALARVHVAKRSYHEAFSAACKEILPQGVVDKIHVRARAIAGGHGKAAARAAARDQQNQLRDGVSINKGRFCR